MQKPTTSIWEREGRIYSARAGAQRWPGGEGAWAHAEAGAEGRGDVAEEVAAAGAAAVAAEGSGDIGAEPVAAGFALRVDALHREAGQELHIFSLRNSEAQINLNRCSATTKRF
jgi:hypothetical protein